MSRRRSLPLRHAGPSRSVVWFPRFDSSHPIHEYRERHDPKAGLIAPHLTLVFPFSSTLSSLQIETHVKRVVRIWPLLPVTFQGAHSYLDEFLFLHVRHGGTAIVELHRQLHRGILAPFLRSDIPFIPHVTVGRSSSREELRQAVADTWMLDRPTTDTMREVTLLEVTPDGRARPEAIIALDQA
jgi:2'-5' RNA ligase